MTSLRRVSLAGGLAYLVTFVASIPALPLLAPVVDDARYVLGAGADSQVILGALCEFVTALACIATALALYPVTRQISRTSALGFIVSRTVEAGIILIGVVSILTVVTLRSELGGSPDAPAELVPLSRALVAIRSWSFLFGPGMMPAVNALFLATLLHRSALVPKILPVLGLVGAPLLMAKSVAVSFGLMQDLSATAMAFALPIALWELGLGLWLTFRGFPRPAESADRPRA